jgi:hypothetical protein
MSISCLSCEVDAHVLAVFVFQGFIAAAPWTDADADSYGGRSGAARELVGIVEIYNSELTRYLAAGADIDLPAALDQEVSEPLGAWYRRNRHAGFEAARNVARKLVKDCFEKSMAAASESAA